MSVEDEQEEEFVIEGEPRTEVYISTQGNICINQISDDDESDETVYFSIDEAECVIGYLQKCIALRREGFIPVDDEDDDEDNDDDDGEEGGDEEEFEVEDDDFDEDDEDDDEEEEEDGEDDADVDEGDREE